MAEAKSTKIIELSDLPEELDYILDTDKKNTAFDELREMVRNSPTIAHWKDDYAMLSRFLKDDKYNAQKCLEHLLTHKQFRIEQNLDNILERPPPYESIFMRYVPQIFHLSDKTGRPIFIERTGFVDQSSLCRLIDLEQSLERHKWFMELLLHKCRESAIANNSHIENVIMIKDLKGLNSVPPKKTIDIFQELSKMERLHYPETLGVVYVINTPWIFFNAWKVMKHFVHSDTRKKIRILGTNWKEVLSDDLGADNLPEEFGGNHQCSTRNRSSCVPVPGESGFMDGEIHDDSELLGDSKDYKTMSIGSKHRSSLHAGSETDLYENRGYCGRCCTMAKNCLLFIHRFWVRLCCKRRIQRRRGNTAANLQSHWMFT